MYCIPFWLLSRMLAEAPVTDADQPLPERPSVQQMRDFVVQKLKKLQEDKKVLDVTLTVLRDEHFKHYALQLLGVACCGPAFHSAGLPGIGCCVAHHLYIRGSSLRSALFDKSTCASWRSQMIEQLIFSFRRLGLQANGQQPLLRRLGCCQTGRC